MPTMPNKPTKPARSLALFLLAAAPALAQPSFTGLGLLPGGEYSEAAAVNADGSVVVGRAGNDAGSTHAFRWTPADGMTDLGSLGDAGTYSEANGISGGGSTIVGSSDSNTGIRAVSWDGDAGPFEIDPGDGTASIAYGISASGKFSVGYIANGAEVQAARWLGGGATDLLGFVPGDDKNSTAFAANADGSVVAGGGYPTPFRWTQETGIVGLGLLPGASGDQPGAAYASNTDGSILAGAVDSDVGLQAFRWTQAGGLVGLGQLSGFASAAFDMSADGSVIVGFILDFGPAPFIWDQAHGMRLLQGVLANDYGLAGALDGWTLENATAISADGLTIVGTAVHEFEHGQFRSEGWAAYLGAPACYPDFDGTGSLDLFDFLAFVNAFNAGEGRADCDANGLFDLFDFLCFVNAFNAGC